MSTFARAAQEILTKTYVIEQKRTVGNHRRTWFTAGLRELHFAKLPASFTASGTNTAVTTAVSRTRQHALAALCRTAHQLDRMATDRALVASLLQTAGVKDALTVAVGNGERW